MQAVMQGTKFKDKATGAILPHRSLQDFAVGDSIENTFNGKTVVTTITSRVVLDDGFVVVGSSGVTQ